MNLFWIVLGIVVYIAGIVGIVVYRVKTEGSNTHTLEKHFKEYLRDIIHGSIGVGLFWPMLLLLAPIILIIKGIKSLIDRYTEREWRKWEVNSDRFTKE